MYKYFFLVFFLVPGPGHLLAAPLWPLSLEASRPHQPDSYTQGLFIYDGYLYESAGLYGQSRLIKSRFKKSGRPEVTAAKKLPDRYFAEGAAEAGGEIYLLTWREGTGFVFDPQTLLIKREFSYPGEGWGLAWDGGRLWRSDGSSRLFPHRPGDFAPAGEALTVREGDREIGSLNELEWDPLTGLLLANIYGQDLVAAIDLSDGQVAFWLDARPLRSLARKAGLEDRARPLDMVLNGLALEGDGLWLTGKLWPRMYKVTWPPEGYPGGRVIDEGALTSPVPAP